MANQNNNSHFNNVFCSQHPVIQHLLSQLRDENTPRQNFTALVTQITLLLIYEATAHLALGTHTIHTPLESFEAPALKNPEMIVVPVLRAGLGMVHAFTTIFPQCKIGHMGFFRDEQTLQPQQYYCKMPSYLPTTQFFICDPMIATAGTAIAALNLLPTSQINPIIFISLIAAPEGIKRLQQAHPNVIIYTAAIDRQLNSVGYILPGLGDAGDRLFGTI